MIPTDLNSTEKSTDATGPIPPIPRQNFRTLLIELEAVRYPVRAISEVQELSSKIDSFHQPQVKTQLNQLLKEFNSYRQVRGDGNCFFRALAFQYFSNMQKTSVHECFPDLDKVDLTSCYPDSIPKQFRHFYDHRFLMHALEENWSPELNYTLSKYSGNFNRSLARLIGDKPFLDFIVILYMRAVCLMALNKIKTELKEYLQGDEEQHIKTYGEQSQGVVLDLCNRFLQVDIDVYEIRTKEVKVYEYHSKKPRTSVQLLFFENHYDLIQRNRQSDIRAEKSQMKKRPKEQDFFTQVSENMIEGACVECNSVGQVYQESSLCVKCYQMSMSTLQNYSKDRMVKARCAQCKYMCHDVSEQFGLCKDCIRIQNRYAEVEKNRPKYECTFCHEEIKSHGKCSRCNKNSSPYKNKEVTHRTGRCVSCGYLQSISIETAVCDFCLRAQQRHGRLLFNNQNKTKCESCKQEIDPKKQHRCSVNSCVKCGRKRQFLSPESFCNACAQAPKKSSPTKNAHEKPISVINTYDDRKCKQCKKLCVVENLVEGLCSRCKQRADPYAKFRCQGCRRLATSQLLIQGKCKACRVPVSNLRPQAIKSNEIQHCKSCARTSVTYVIRNDHCPVCRDKFGP